MISKLNTNISLDNQLKRQLLNMKLEDLQYPTGTNALKKYEAEKKYLENKLKKFENILDND